MRPNKSKKVSSTNFVSPCLASDIENEVYFVFNLSRIRCWRLHGNEEDGLQLAFDYVTGKDDMAWTKIVSTSAIFMGMCLQNLVSELMRLKNGERIRRPKDRTR